MTLRIHAAIALTILALTLSAHSTANADGDTRQIAEHLRDRALAGSQAWAILESLTTEIGPRPVGSPAMARAKEWGLRDPEGSGS